MPADVAPLVADGGNIRLVRRVAAYAYGSREVTWPDDAGDPQGELPDGREFGWVAQLAGPRPGLSGRRFVRADAVIDAVEGVSNTEQLLDDAAERTGGDVHFETLISGRGLAGQVPGVDFALGDRVPARFWGRILPGQLVTEVGWDESGPYAKLGGQMLRDLDALARTRAELTRTIRKEREETAGEVEAVRSAVSRERTERQEDVAQVREVLGGAQADEQSLVSQLAAVQAQITGMVGDGETPPPAGMLNAYLWMNTRLWEAQREINAAQQARDADYQEQLGQIMAVMDEQAATIERLQAQSVSVSPMMILAEGPDWMRDGYNWVALGDWTGSVRITEKDSNERVRVRSWSVPKSDGSRRYSITADFQSGEYQKHPGTQSTRKLTWDYIRDTVAGQWRTLATTTIGNTKEVFVDATAWLDAAHRGATYRLAIVIDGTTRKMFTSSSVGPLLPSGDGHVPIRVQGTFSAAKNSRVEVQYSCSFEGVGDVQQRRVRSGSVKLSWIEAVG